MQRTPRPIKLSRIYLDLDNPRHEPQASESEAIQRLIADDDVRALAKHIAETGETSPLESMAVMRHDVARDGFTALEGNRRLCALKLLADPDRASKETDREYFHRLRRKLPAPIDEIMAVEFENREEAHRWIGLRHDPPVGVGTKTWNAEQKTRFNRRGRGDTPNARALDVMDYAREQELLSDEELAQLTLTTLTRFLNTPTVRAALGMTDSKTLEIDVPIEEFDRAISQLLRDSIGADARVHSRADSAARKAYAESLRSTGVSPITRGLIPFSPGSQVPPAPEAPTQPAPAPQMSGRDNRHPDTRKYVIPSGFSVRIQDPLLRRLYGELKRLEIASYPFSAVSILRAVLERATVLYLKKGGISPSQGLHKKLGQLAELLKAEGMTDPELKNLRTLSTTGKDDPNSADSLGNFVHGAAVPPPGYATRFWDNIERVMKRVLNGV